MKGEVVEQLHTFKVSMIKLREKLLKEQLNDYWGVSKLTVDTVLIFSWSV